VTAALSAEWVKLWSLRSSRRAVAVAVLLSVLVSWGLVAVVRQMVAEGRRDLAALDIATAVLTRSPTTPLVVGLIGIAAITQEYRYGTITTTQLVTPARWRIYGAKALLLSGVAAVVALLSLAVGWVVMVLGLAPQVSLALPPAAALRLHVVDVLLVVGWGLIGLALGTLLRSRSLAAVVMISDAFVLEPAVRIALGGTGTSSASLADFLPFSAAAAMVTDTSGEGAGALTTAGSGLGAGASLLVFVAWVAVLVAGAGAVFDRRG
jgi:ABC-2 type transport system permease protein